MLYEVDKMLKEHGDKVDASVKETIATKRKAVEDAKGLEDAPAIDRALEELNTSMQEVGRKVYEQVARQTPPPGAGGGEPSAAEGRAAAGEEAAKGSGQGKVIDADFEVK